MYLYKYIYEYMLYIYMLFEETWRINVNGAAMDVI